MKRFLQIIIFIFIFSAINSYADNLNKIFDLTAMAKSSESFYNTLLSNEKSGIKTTAPYLRGILADNGFDPYFLEEDPNNEEAISAVRDVLAANMLVMYFIENYRSINNQPNAFSDELNSIFEGVKSIYSDLKDVKTINCSENKFIEDYNTEYKLLVNELYSKDFKNLILDKNTNLNYFRKVSQDDYLQLRWNKDQSNTTYSVISHMDNPITITGYKINRGNYESNDQKFAKIINDPKKMQEYLNSSSDDFNPFNMSDEEQTKFQFKMGMSMLTESGRKEVIEQYRKYGYFKPVTLKFGESINLFTIPNNVNVLEVEVETNNGNIKYDINN